MSVDPAKPLGRVAQKRLKITQDILTAALDILSEQGVEGLTLAAVTERLGVSKPAIYHYFRSKEDLIRNLVLELLHQETTELVDAVAHGVRRDAVLGVLIRAFYRHYRPRLHAFRLVYCQFQLLDIPSLGIGKSTLRRDINPLTHKLFDLVLSVLGERGRLQSAAEARQLAFSAWLSAVGLVEMISIADAADDPLRHSDEALLKTLENVFNAAAERLPIDP